MINYSQILSIYYPNENWAISNNDYQTLQWGGDSAKPTQAELDALWPSTQIEINKQIQKERRLSAYEQESDPLFFKWQRNESTQQEWLDKVEEIKQRFPY
jgi:hypothetical protein